MKDSAKRLRDWIDKNFKTIAECARYLEITPQGLQHYIQGRATLPLELSVTLEQKGFDRNWYLNGIESNIEETKINFEMNIPIYDISVYANVGGGITEISQIPSSNLLVTPNYKDCIGFKAIGDSMTGDDIKENDILIVNPKQQPRDNSVVVVNLNGLLLVKRIKIVENNKWELHSSKQGILPITEYDQDTLIYIGKVIEVRKNYL